LEYTRLYAPFCGFIQKKLFDAHETIGAGMPVISMVSAGIPEVEINLPAADYIRRDRFDGYHCTFDLYPGENYPLKLISVTPKANANQLYTMRLQMVPGKLPLPSPGMNTMVTIYCNEGDSQPVSVPGGALLQKDGKTYVFVYDPSAGKVHSCEVTVLRLLSDGRAMVVSDTLHAGEIVVASGVHHIEDGENVRPLATGSKTNVGGLL
jgi:RND family efflux transporter MFP subunit